MVQKVCQLRTKKRSFAVSISMRWNWTARAKTLSLSKFNRRIDPLSGHFDAGTDYLLKFFGVARDSCIYNQINFLDIAV